MEYNIYFVLIFNISWPFYYYNIYIHFARKQIQKNKILLKVHSNLYNYLLRAVDRYSPYFMTNTCSQKLSFNI